MFERCLNGDRWKTFYAQTSGTATRVIESHCKRDKTVHPAVVFPLMQMELIKPVTFYPTEDKGQMLVGVSGFFSCTKRGVFHKFIS